MGDENEGNVERERIALVKPIMVGQPYSFEISKRFGKVHYTSARQPSGYWGSVIQGYKFKRAPNSEGQRIYLIEKFRILEGDRDACHLLGILKHITDTEVGLLPRRVEEKYLEILRQERAQEIEKWRSEGWKVLESLEQEVGGGE